MTAAARTPLCRIGADIGGTFTDFVLNPGDGGALVHHKVGSTPDRPEEAVLRGAAEALASRGLDAAAVAWMAHGTTVGTNALIQRRCGRVALVTSEGFRDLIEIGRQTRPSVYDMHRDHPPPLVPRSLRYEVPQRRLADGSPHRRLDESATAAVGRQLAAAAVDCVVVCFLHSYAWPEDEARAVEILRGELPTGVAVIASSSVHPEFREYERFSTAVLNGALLTVVGAYLDRLSDGVRDLGVRSEPKISRSSGGLMSVRMARQLPVAACLSGPAAGVAGAARRAAAAGFRDVITLDVGGTSADVCLLRGGAPAEVDERDLAGFPLRMPALDVNAVGAGGGSVAWVDRDGLLKVGPRSAGAVPGPACYGLGGEEPTLTDANVLLGRLDGEALLGGRMPIERARAERAVRSVASQLGTELRETALGVVRVACAVMAKAIRSVSVERGHDPRSFALFAYGGAGPLHAVELARDLGIPTVVVPPNPGLLCAEGAMNADLVAEFVRAVLAGLDSGGVTELRAAHAELSARAERWFDAEGIPAAGRRRRWTAAARYYGQNYELSVPVDPALDDRGMADAIAAHFRRAHEAAYGFASDREPVQIVHLKARAAGLAERPPLPELPTRAAPAPVGERRVAFDGGSAVATPVLRRGDLGRDLEIRGPAIIEQMDATTLVFPGDRCAVDRWGDLVIEVGERGA